MKTTRKLAGAVLSLSIAGLAACTAAESVSPVGPDEATGGAGGGGEGGVSIEIIAPDGGSGGEAVRIPIRAFPETTTTSETTTSETTTSETTTSETTTSESTTTSETTTTSTVLNPTETTGTTSTTSTSDPGTTLFGGDPPGGSMPSTAPGTGGSPAAPPEDRCPGLDFTVRPAVVLDVYGSLSGMQDDLTTSCGDPAPEAKNPDVVYQVDFPEATTVTVFLQSTSFEPALSVRHLSCDGEATNDLCELAKGSQLDAAFAVEAGRYWFVVDSADGRTGGFTLEIAAAPTGSD